MNSSRNMAIIMAVLATVGAAAVWVVLKDRYLYAQKDLFLLLLAIPVLGAYHVWSTPKRYAKVQLSTLGQFGDSSSSWTELQLHLPFLLRSLALSLLIAAIARPQSELSWQNVATEGIDIVIAMDISASMLARDFKPDRLESSKQVAEQFINGRPNDRIGLVLYEGEAFTQSPLTTDHRSLVSHLRAVRTGVIKDGTAIGMGLGTAVNRLRESEARSKVIILTTDGENNSGTISPMTAADIAVSYGIRVYTIGVGAIGRAMSPTGIYPDGSYKYEMVEVRIDEDLLRQIADLTGGAYYRATDGNALQNIFQEIDQLEKTRIDVTEHSRRSEKYFWIAALGAALLLMEFLYRHLILQTLP